VYDGFSVDILFREISSIYPAKLQGRPSLLPPLKMQYAEFAEWQLQQFDAPKYQKQRAYWQESLAKPLPVLDLPIDFPRPPVNSEEGVTINRPLSVALTQQLMQVCEQTKASLFAVLLSAYFVWLHRMTQEKDIIVGSTFRARSERDVKDLMGYFVNALPIRVHMEGLTTFHDVLSAVRKRLFSAMKNQDYPFDMIVETVNPDRDPSRPVLHSTIFDLQIPSLMKIEGLEFQTLDSRKITANSDLTWNVIQKPDHLSLDVVYNVTLFQRETIERFIGQFENLLQAIVQDLDAPVHLLPILTVSERNQLLTQWSDARAEFGSDACLHQIFEAQAEKTPDRIALTFEDQNLSYRELNERANRVAHRLQKLGVGPDVLVGLMFERSVEVVVGLLAILKAGGAYVPLDPSYPADRLVFMLEDSEIPVLVTKEQLIAELPAHHVQVICFDRDHAEIAAQPAINPSHVATPEDLAYVIYTSGSTGKPKGVLIQHVNVTRLFDGTHDWYQFNENDVWTLFHSYAFDFSVWEIWGALLYGGRLVVVPHLTSREPKEFHRLLCEEGVTVLNQTPSAFYQLMQADERSGLSDQLALRYVIFGGEALELQYLKPWFQRHGDEQPLLVNMYGITETTVHVTYRPIRMIDIENATGSVIGIPIPDLHMYVLDQHLQPVPYGVTGEMYVGGAGVARGYLKRPDLTAERFIDDPFRPNQKLYKTGDLARLLSNGELEYKGRIDHQVKIRGFRIELGEIESQLLQHPSIRETVVLVREDVPGDKRLVAYVVLDEAQSADVKVWQAHLRDRLPIYMVPSAFVVLEVMPLTSNGKVDRKALPRPDASGSSEEEYVAPRTGMEEIVAGIWADVLRVERVGVYDNFFDTGGHSLLATQVMSRLAVAFSVQVPLKALFEAPTVAELASRVEGLQQEQGFVEFTSIERVSRESQLQLSFAQQRLWVLDRLIGDGEGAIYNIPGAIRLHGELNEVALEQAFQEIVARHEALRTTFAEVDGEPVQVITESPLILEKIDLTAIASDEREAQVNCLVQEEMHRPFDLAVGPLVRCALVRFAKDEHALIMNFHHIVYDGWSMDVLFNELSQLYTAFVAGEESPLAPLPIQYADYAQWQREWLDGGVIDDQLSYWKQQLNDLPVLELLTDRPRPSVQTYKGRTERFELSKELTDALQALSQQQGATLYMTLLGAFQTLLARYSGQEDIVIGTPIAGRQRREVEELIGFFVNMLVIRTDLSGQPNFREVLGRVRETALSAYAHQDVPFEKLVEELQPERDMSRSPLFQVMFTLQNTPLQPQFGNLQANLVEPDIDVAKDDLTLHMTEKSDGLSGMIMYNTDLFDTATIERMSGHFRNLLESIAANPELPIGQIDFLTAQDRDMYARINNTAVEYDLNHLLTDAFVEQATAHPERIALIFEDRTMTYGELHERSNRLAHYLRAQGVQRNQLVAIMMERSMEMMVGLYGIIKSGAAYVPIDPDYPADRIEYMLADSDARVLLTKQMYLDVMPNVSAVLLMEEELNTASDAFAGAEIWRDLADYPMTMPEPINDPSDLVYMIYTSGSTGQPKGVQIQHASIVNYLNWHQDEFGCTPDDVIIQRTTASFDASVTELFWSLRHGASVSIMSQEVLFDPHRLIAQLVRDRATYIQFVPSLLAVVLNAMQEHPLEDHPRLRTIVNVGEALPATLVQQWFNLFPGTRFANLYGPTEATIHVTYDIYEAAITKATIGKPVANTQIYVLSADGQLCPVNVKGELFIGGVQLAVGYHNKPEKTASVFVPNHLRGTPGDRLYRTGDAVRLLPDGNIEYLGRNDDQVKIRGMRIELGEIESALMNHEAIQRAVVMAQEVIPGDKRLVAYLVLDGVSSADVTTWQEHLRERVPAYMVPAAFVVLESLPLTPNGKVNRKALPKPDASAYRTEDYVQPRTAAEETVAAIWSELLRAERIGAYDNFFKLGGHSLLATQAMSRLASAFSVDVPIKVLFEAPTVAELASSIERLQQEQGFVKFTSIERVSRESQLQLSFAQQRMWVLDRLIGDGEGAIYNIPIAIRLHGELHEVALEQAFQEIVARHEALRTTFAEVDGEPVQVITESPLVLEKIDRTATSRDEREAQVNCLVQEEMHRPFDLAVGPLVRFALVRFAEDEHALIMNFHHIVYDGWSMDVLFNELSQLYTAFVTGEESPLAPMPIQYADYAVWQRDWLNGGVLDHQLSYWKQNLADLTVLQLPTDRPRPSVQTYKGRTVRFELSKELTDALQALSQQQGATLYMTLLGAFQTLLARHSGQEDIVVGTPIAGRQRRELEELIGFFVNTLVIRTDLSGQPNFREVLNRVRETALSAFAHQDVPFERLVEELQPERDMSLSPLFQVMFSMQNTPLLPKFSELQVNLVEPDIDVAKFDLNLLMTEKSDGLSGMVAYNTDLFDTATIERMIGYFCTLLQGITANPETPVHQLPILTEQEQHQLLVEWNNNGAEYPQNVCTHQLFEQQAEKTPDSIAVRFEDKQLTYRELNERANRVAHRLQK
ncbi:MAG: amino acid adenylation domain-containing protein, partial [Tumebacillaceae bacterium]